MGARFWLIGGAMMCVMVICIAVLGESLRSSLEDFQLEKMKIGKGTPSMSKIQYRDLFGNEYRNCSEAILSDKKLCSERLEIWQKDRK